MRISGIVDVKNEFGVALQTVLKWCDKGLPHDNTFKGLKPVKRFDLDEVRIWLNEKRKED